MMKISIVAPVYNEEKCLSEFFGRTREVLQKITDHWELIFVDDGSSDKSLEILQGLRQQEPKVKILSFSRNFGHQIAVKAGIDHVSGDAVIVMDADLQDPPEAIPDLIAKWKEGYEVVYVVRAKRAGENWFKKASAAIFYRFIKKISSVDIPVDTGDFRLISKSVIDVLKGIKEKNPYIRGLTSWIGFKQTGIKINRPARFAGETKYSLKKMLHLAFSGILHFSFAPLRLSLYAGFISILGSFLWILIALYRLFIFGEYFSSTGSILAAVFFLGGIQLLAIGILGSYLARNYEEARPRPLYVVRNKEGF